jgi:DNA polymerase-3 subunit epsilon
MRLVVLDTETTGLDVEHDRIIEVGAVILDGFQEIDKVQHYFNPEYPVSPGAQKVHGLSNEFLSQFETFCCKKIGALVERATLVIHNAPFDMKFLNKEFERQNLPPLKNTVIDTLKIARQKFPGAPANLDALCARFKVSNKHRNLHGALVDALLLARVYNHLRNQGVTELRFDTANKDTKVTTLSNAMVAVNPEEQAAYKSTRARVSGQ